VNKNVKCKLFETKIPQEPLGGLWDFAPIKRIGQIKMIEVSG